MNISHSPHLKIRKHPGKLILRFLTIVVGVIALILTAWIAIAGPVTVFRIIRYGDTNIDDYSHYPGRPLQSGDGPFRFLETGAGLRIPATSLIDFGSEGDLEQLLAANDTIVFLVVRGEELVYERYFQGHSAGSISQVFSVSKSFTSALIGLAIDDGYILGEHQAITDFIPELIDKGFTDVTIRHLLTMMSGTDYVENDNPFGEHVILNFTPALEERILEIRMENIPGETFRYKSGDNALLALALDRALGGERITDYTQRRLWTPLGMESGGFWTIDHTGDGLEKTWCCLAASGRDLARFGRLYLNMGAWEGDRILSSEWIQRSTRVGYVPEDAWPADFSAVGWWNYGYHWWLASPETGDYFALGKDGQFLYLNPDKDLIVVRLGWSSGDLSASRWIALFRVIANEIDES